MKKLFVLAFLFVAFSAAIAAPAQKGNSNVIGEWKYEVPSAPEGYNKGSLIISEEEGKLAGEVKFADGYKIELKNITFEEGTLKCGLYVDYEYVSVNVKINGKEMTGKVNSPEGEMTMKAEKVK